MRNYKYLVNGYNKKYGEFSVGFTQIDKALFYYKNKLEEIKEYGGESELLKVSVLQFFNN